jgi:hypothetical protein
MNCADLISSLGFSCKQLSGGAIRLWSPFTYGRDGQLVSLFVEPTNGGFLVSDNAQSFMHAVTMGVDVTKSRLEMIRAAISDQTISVSKSGEITAVAHPESLGSAIVGVLNAALTVSAFESTWMPRSQATFERSVGVMLESILGTRLKTKVKVTGASGHQMEFPFAVDAAGNTTYIQTVAYGHGRVDWSLVYRGLGKMLDLKNADPGFSERAIILEDSPDEELAKAATLLSNSAKVVPFSRAKAWAQTEFGIAV